MEMLLFLKKWLQMMINCTHYLGQSNCVTLKAITGEGEFNGVEFNQNNRLWVDKESTDLGKAHSMA